MVESRKPVRRFAGTPVVSHPNPLLRWFLRFGILVVAALPLLAYELVAVASGKVPTITHDTRDFIHTNWWIHVLFLLGWALLTSHFFANWP